LILNFKIVTPTCVWCAARLKLRMWSGC